MSESVGYPVPFLDFMGSFAIFLDTFGTSGIKWATLVKSAGSGELPDTYFLKDAGGAGPGHFKIYWCQYSRDAVYTETLADEAHIMFTPKMDGCTFAVGIPALDGTVTVGHANVYNWTNDEMESLEEEMFLPETSQTRQIELMQIRLQLVRARQLEMLTNEFGLGSSPVTIKKQLNTTNAEYTGSKGGIITFGVLDTTVKPNKWRFYFQTKNGMNKVTGVHKIKK